MNEHILDNNLGSLNLYFSVDKVNYLQITIEFIKKNFFLISWGTRIAKGTQGNWALFYSLFNSLLLLALI